VDKAQFSDEEEHLKALVMKTCRLTYNGMQGIIGTLSVKMPTPGILFKHLSDQLESLCCLLIWGLIISKITSRREGLAFLLKYK
jgi:hypothetical protein